MKVSLFKIRYHKKIKIYFFRCTCICCGGKKYLLNFSSVLMSHKLIWQNYQPAKSFNASHCATPEFSSSLLSNVVLCYFIASLIVFLFPSKVRDLGTKIDDSQWAPQVQTCLCTSPHMKERERTWTLFTFICWSCTVITKKHNQQVCFDRRHMSAFTEQ